MKRDILISVAAVILFSSYVMAGTWQTIDMPGAMQTALEGIDGDNIVVFAYGKLFGGHYVYDGLNWTRIPKISFSGTTVTGISGNNIVGYYGAIGSSFLYDGTNLTSIDKPEAYATFICGIYGNNMYGSYTDTSTITHGFIYDGLTWTNLDYPGASSTAVFGISGNCVVGDYDGKYSFLYEGSTWTNLEVPGFSCIAAKGISGSNIIGWCNNYGWYPDGSEVTDSFLYDGSTWTILSMPGDQVIGTFVTGISGDKIVGYYTEPLSSSTYRDLTYHGFIYTIPEPCTLLLFGLGAAVISRKKTVKSK
jgi:hypothetical protein